MLEVDDLGVRLGKQEVLANISMRLEPGKTVALIGPNGAGKSTLLRALAGLVPAHGHLQLEGRSSGQNLKEIAYMPQDTSTGAALSVLEIVLMGRLERLGFRIPHELRAEAMALLSGLGLELFAHRPIGSLSGGQRQMVFLAQTLFRAPRVMLLDEPTAALDLCHQMVVLERIRGEVVRRRAVAIIAVHDLTLAAHVADRVVCLHQGRIVADGPPRNVLTVSLLQEIYGIEAEIAHLPSGALAIVPMAARSKSDMGRYIGIV